MSKRTERPTSMVPFYMYRGQAHSPATSRFSVRGMLIWGVGLVLIGLVSWLYLLQASQVASYAHEIRTLQLAKERIHRQNTVLRGQVAVAGSLARIREVGQQLGYSLPDAEDLARRMVVVYEPAPTATPAATVLGEQAAVEVQTGARRLIARFAEQLNAWLKSSQPEDSGD